MMNAQLQQQNLMDPSKMGQSWTVGSSPLMMPPMSGMPGLPMQVLSGMPQHGMQMPPGMQMMAPMMVYPPNAAMGYQAQHQRQVQLQAAKQSSARGPQKKMGGRGPQGQPVPVEKPLLPSGERDPRVERYDCSGKTPLGALNEFCAKQKVASGPTFKEEMMEGSKVFKITVQMCGMDWGWGESTGKVVAKHLAANETLKMLINQYDGTGCIIPGIDKMMAQQSKSKGAKTAEGSSGVDFIEDMPGGPANFNYGPEEDWAKWTMSLNMFCQFHKFTYPTFTMDTETDPQTKKPISTCQGSFTFTDLTTGEERTIEGKFEEVGKRKAQHKLAAKFLALAIPGVSTSFAHAIGYVESIRRERKNVRLAEKRQKREEIREMAKRRKLESLEETANEEVSTTVDEDGPPGVKVEDQSTEEETPAPATTPTTKVCKYFSLKCLLSQLLSQSYFI